MPGHRGDEVPAEIGVSDLGPFYLEIARRAHDQLTKLKGKPLPVRLTQKGQLASPSSHYRHAVTCIVFSAVAVEHELMRLIAVRIMIQAGDDRSRKLMMGVWPERPRIDDMIRFVRLASRVDPTLLGQVKVLFKDRNGLVHSGTKMKRTVKERLGGRYEWEASVDMARLGPGIVDTAKRDIQIAGRAITALRNAITEPEWKTFRHVRR